MTGVWRPRTMMSDHVTHDDLRRFGRGDLPPDRVLAVAQHLGTCPPCAELGRESAGADAPASLRLAVAGAPEHPTAEELSDYVDGIRQEEITTHLRVCAPCRAEVEDLDRFRKRIAPSRWWIGAASAAAVMVAVFIAMIARRVPSESPPHPRAVVSIRPSVPPSRPGSWQALITQAVSNGRIAPPPFLREIRGGRDEVRGTAIPSAVTGETLQPSAVVVATDRPRFTWPAKGRHAIVSVFDGARRVARSSILGVSEWVPAKPLPRGRTYQWQVELRNGATHLLPTPPDPPAAFHVMDEASFRDLTAAQRERPDDHLLLGVLYARAGAQHDAAKELAAYRNEHPEDLAAQQLAESVQAW